MEGSRPSTASPRLGRGERDSRASLKTVLLIEDSRLHAELVRALLETPDPEFRLECVRRLDEGLDRLSRGGVDAVLLDLNLPDSEGLDTFRRIHSRIDVPIVVLTSLEDEDLGTAAIRAGAQDYLVKTGVSHDLLGRSLRYAVERGRLTYQLRSANQALKDFISIVSHEMRNPLGAIQLFAEVLLIAQAAPSSRSPEGEGVREQRKLRGSNVDVLECARRIHDQAQGLLGLVDNLLKLSTIEAGSLRARPETVSVSKVLERVLAALAHMGVQVESECPEDLCVHADAMHLKHILGNYISNAAKYGAPPVRVEAQSTNDWVEIRVRDRGEGLSHEFASRAFERFSRGEGGGRTSGAGLGLFICRELARAGGGEVWYEPDPQGGSSFGVRLPDAVTSRVPTAPPRPPNGASTRESN